MSKQLLDPTTIMFLAGIVLIAVLASYSSSKGAEAFKSPPVSTKQDGGDLNPSVKQVHQAATGKDSQGVTGASGNSSNYASVQGMNSQQPNLPSCTQQPAANPQDLLPAPGSNAFGQPVAPADVNFLQAGYHIGIDTVGQSLRNANLQVRSEPPNPQSSVGPWQNSTIGPDLMRVPLEIGCGPQ